MRTMATCTAFLSLHGLPSTLTASLHGRDDENDGNLYRFLFFGLPNTLTASLHGSVTVPS